MKKYEAESERLRRYIYSRWETIDEFAKEVGVSSDSIRVGYTSGRSLMGGDLMRKLIPHGFDPVFYLTGEGLSPDGNETEIALYVARLRNRIKTLSSYLEKVKALKAAAMKEAGL